jgi:hypothetical protein
MEEPFSWTPAPVGGWRAGLKSAICLSIAVGCSALATADTFPRAMPQKEAQRPAHKRTRVAAPPHIDAPPRAITPPHIPSEWRPPLDTRTVIREVPSAPPQEPVPTGVAGASGQEATGRSGASPAEGVR